MMSRSTIVVLAFAAGAAIFALGLSTTLQRAIGMGPPAKTAILPKPSAPELISSLLSMSDEQIKLAQIDLVDVGPAAIAKRLVVPGSVVPDADRIAHVSVKLSGTVAELRKNIGEDVARDEVIAVLESREVADAKSEYLAAGLTNDLQQDLSTRDKTLWDSRVGTEQQYLRSRNAAAQTEMRLKIARQKLLALGLGEKEITAVPKAPEASLRRQDVRSPISGRVAERKVELGTAVGRDSLETELFVVVDLSRVWVELSVASSDLPLIKEGQQVKISARGLTETATGKIVFVSPLVDKDTRTARVVAEMQNPDRMWRPGSFVTAAIALNERTVPLVVPATAIQKLDGQPIVFVRTKDGFEKRDVVLGEREDQTVEIVSGLTPGEAIAATNTFPLKAELSKPRDED
ncbi:efflux RND transporter periplasmic adaptor subunit [uncultured Bradyrhizobium sp.]|jgi:cobalt-zinc-cadmium efflux system membrane fusion protein|nr:efflux RND transporter periplasmic adaptor subunit [uncultured Bradyrhizobium sp.]KQW18193.1 cation transporter [Afipia sp. Root123D2]